MKCPYCEKEAKARGLKNHVRLSSGDGHGDKGEIPDDFEGGVQTDSDPSDEAADDTADDGEDTTTDSKAPDAPDAAEVTAEDLTTNEEPKADTGESEASDGLPFDPDDDGAIRLDGDEQIHVRHEGEVVQASPADGDYLLMTDSGPILWDKETDERFEVVTA